MNAKKKNEKAKPLTKKELRKLEKERKIEEERLLREAEEQRIKEEQRKIEEELEKKRQELIKYQKEEEIRLGEEYSQFQPHNIVYKQSLDAAVKGMNENIRWKEYLMCNQEIQLERESELNLFLMTLSETIITDFKTFDVLLNVIDSGLDVIKQINARMIDFMSNPNHEKEKKFLGFNEKILKLILKKFKEIHSFILHMADGIVAQKLQEIKNGQNEGAVKTNKTNENKPEIQISYKRKNFALAYWIMAFENSGIRPTPIDFKDLSFMSDLPKAFFSKKLIMYGIKFFSNTLNYKRFFKYRSKPNIISQIKSEFWPVEGFTDMGCLNILPESNQIGELVVKQLFKLKESLQPMVIPTMEGTNTNFRIYMLISESKNLEEKEEVFVSYYDKTKKMWSKDGLGLIFHEINEYKKRYQITAYVPMIAPFCLMQSIMFHLPYQNFLLKRCRADMLLFDIEFKNDMISFKILPGSVMVKSTTLNCLSHLKDKSFSPSEMLIQLAESNVLLIPRYHSLINEHAMDVIDDQILKPEISSKNVIDGPKSKQSFNENASESQTPDKSDPSLNSPAIPVSVKEEPISDQKILQNGLKDFDLNDFVIEEICRNSLNFYIKLSKFNFSAGRDKVVLGFKENMSMERNIEQKDLLSFRNVLFSNKKCELLKSEEDQDVFSFDRVDGTVSHLNFKMLSEKYADSFQNVSSNNMYTNEEFLLIDTLYRLLKPMDLIAFSN